VKSSLIIYEGKKFTVEWYIDAKGKSKAFEYFDELPLDRQKKLLSLVRLIADLGKLFNKEKFRYEGEYIYVFKPMPDRYFCFFYQDAKIIVTNAYEKKTDKLSVPQKDKALKLKADYELRCKRGTYYE
jgi:phage-related protein